MKPTKRTPKLKSQLTGNKYFIQHIEDPNLVIEVPKYIVETFRKIRNIKHLYNLNHFVVDVIAATIHLRDFDKILTGLARVHGVELCEKECDKLVKFLNSCPPGFDLSNLIRPHIEFKPVLTK